MKLKYQLLISLALIASLLFLSKAALADEIQGNLGQGLETGLTGSVTNCSPLTVTNGSVAAYPTCTITCNSGYSLSGSSCVAAGGGGGGGGGGAVTYCSSVTYANWGACNGSLQYRAVATQTPSSCTLTTAQQVALQQACDPSTVVVTPVVETPTVTVTPSNSGTDLITNILAESAIVSSGNPSDLMSHLANTQDLGREATARIKYKKILALDKKISAEEIDAILRFIVYGTRTTQILGEGERAGVINSYFNAYGKLPNSAEEWADLIKIANGRWPVERSTKAETQAKIEFKKVYARNAVLSNNVDENAIMVIAYGLLPSARNLASEKVAIKTFRWVYAHPPVSALAWNVVRAIAYSGAKR